MTTQSAIPVKTRRILLCIYGAAFFYFVLKLVYYAVFIGGFPDQRAQLSYIIEMCRTPSFLPDFSAMPMYEVFSRDGGSWTMQLAEGAVNYLGHPPLYYLLMSLAGGVRFLQDGVVSVDYLRLCLWNIVLVSAGTALALRLGRKHLRERSPLVHAVYAAAVVTLPELGYVGAGVNNDNLAFTAFVVFFAGLLRYQEDRTDLKTYLLIGTGFLLGSLSKLTMAMIMTIILLAVLVMSIFRTRTLKLITSREFLMTLPCYLLFLAYELAVHRRYGAWHPGLAAVAPEYYRTTVFYVAPEDRVSLTFPRYLYAFLNGIRYTWSSLYGHNTEVTELMNNRVAGLIYWIPVAAAFVSAVIQCIRRKFDRFTLPVMLAFFGTLAYHALSGWSGYLQNGYTGGTQARYYLPLIIPFALILCEYFPPLFRTRKAKLAGTVLAVFLIAGWLAGDVPKLVTMLGFAQI